MRWHVRLDGSPKDVERLSAAGIEGLSVDPENSSALVLEGQVDAAESDATSAAKAACEVLVQQINSFGKLRWGRRYDGFETPTTVSIDSDGHVTQVAHLGLAHAHLSYEKYAEFVEALGEPRPAMPEGLETIRSLDLAQVLALAEANPNVARVLHLIDLMLVGDADIDWVAAYAALEIIHEDLADRNEADQMSEWWTKAERKDFRATANSPEALGVRARHGKRSGLTEARMAPVEASWLVRRITAYWLVYLGEPASAEADRPGR